MTYQVFWNSDAEADLASIWISASDRRAVAEASDWLDKTLRNSPHSLGESRTEQVRIGFCLPLAVEFEIHEADQTVLVLAVWVFGRRTERQ